MPGKSLHLYTFSFFVSATDIVYNACSLSIVSRRNLLLWDFFILLNCSKAKSWTTKGARGPWPQSWIAKGNLILCVNQTLLLTFSKELPSTRLMNDLEALLTYLTWLFIWMGICFPPQAQWNLFILTVDIQNWMHIIFLPQDIKWSSCTQL